MLPSILDFAMVRWSISSGVSGPSFSNAGKISQTFSRSQQQFLTKTLNIRIYYPRDNYLQLFLANHT